jgi:hypothetical protein
LAVAASTLIHKTRRLPLKGQVVVEEGSMVEPSTIVARTEIPGVLRTVRAKDILGCESNELEAALLVRLGDAVTSGQVLARTSAFFGLFKSDCKSPIDGVIEVISHVTGHIGIRDKAMPVVVNAYVRGRVSQVLPEEGVVLETRGAFIQGIFGVGGERQGTLRMVVADPGQPVTENDVRPEHKGLILAGGSNISGAALRKAAEIGVRGIVVGAIIDRDLIDFLGYDIGVAITGHEAIDITLIVTEGFGTIRMADRTYRLLKSLEGQEASINGATQIRAGVMRPEVIVPHLDERTHEDATREQELIIGTPIRVIREPYFGRLGQVAGLPHELQQIPSGAMVRVLEANLDGECVVVPRANVEIIEA